MDEERQYIEAQVLELAELLNKKDTFEIESIKKLAARVTECFGLGGTLAFAGNGGSAAEANHLSAEFVGRCVVNHKPLKAVSLSDNSSVITALVNDYGSNQLFARQVEALLDSRSILIGLSTSGESRNILEGLKKAKEIGVYTILWTSIKQVEKLDFLDEVWKVNSRITPRIQEVHLIWGHLLAEVVERNI